MLAHQLVEAGVVHNVLVVRARTGSRVRRATGDPDTGAGRPSGFEVPLGPTIPAYYGLVASRYMHEFGVTEEQTGRVRGADAPHAAAHPGAQFREPITVADVLASRSIATPLKLLDCCPVSDGGAAFIVSRDASTISASASWARGRRTRTSI